MGNCSTGAGRRKTFGPPLLLVLLAVSVGCATSKPRFATLSNAGPSQPAAVQVESGPVEPPLQVIPETPSASADVHPVAYQQTVEEIPALTAPETAQPLDMST